MFTVLIALCSSLSYGVSDYLGGLKAKTLPLITVLMVSHVTALTALMATLLIGAETMPDARYFGFGMLAGLAEAIGIAALYRGLSTGKMSIVAAVAATAPVVPVVVSVLSGEVPRALQSAGIVLAVSGIVMLALGSGAEDQPAATSRPAVSIFFGAVTALGLGSFLLAMDEAASGSVQWALITARIVSSSIFAFVLVLVRPKGDPSLRDWGVMAVIGLLILAADSLYAIATTRGVLSVVAVLSSLYPLVTILLARFHLGERLTRGQVAGIGVVLSGTAVLSVG